MGAGRNGRRLGPHPWRLGAIWQARARLEAERVDRGGTPEGACCQDRRIQLGFKPAQGVFLSGPSLRLTGLARAIVAPAAVGVRAWRGLGRAGIPVGVRLGRPVDDVRRERLARRRLASTRAVVRPSSALGAGDGRRSPRLARTRRRLASTRAVVRPSSALGAGDGRGSPRLARTRRRGHPRRGPAWPARRQCPAGAARASALGVDAGRRTSVVSAWRRRRALRRLGRAHPFVTSFVLTIKYARKVRCRRER